MMMTTMDVAQFEQVVGSAGSTAKIRDCEGEQHSSNTYEDEDPIYEQAAVQYDLLERDQE